METQLHVSKEHNDSKIDVQISLVPEAIRSALVEFEDESFSGSDDDSIEFCERPSEVMSPVPLRSTHKTIYQRSSFCKSVAEFVSEGLIPTNASVNSKKSVNFSPQLTEIYIGNDQDNHDTKNSNNAAYSKYERVRPKTASGRSTRRKDKMVKSKPVTPTKSMFSSSSPKQVTSKRVKNNRNISNKTTQQRNTSKAQTRGGRGNTNKLLTQSINEGNQQCDKMSKSSWTSLLDKIQMGAFKKLFSRFDKTKSGGISAIELYEAVKELMPEQNVSFDEVKQILKEFDIKCTGEIEFDEFLFAMTHPKNYIKLIQDDDIKQLDKEIKDWDTYQSKVLNKEQLAHKRMSTKKCNMPTTSDETEQSKIFFKMLQEATKEESMQEIRHFYVNKIKKLNDHVIHDWSAGQRCVGLSDQDVIRRYDDIMKELANGKFPFSKEKKYLESPYAKPLRWGLKEIKNGIIKKKNSLDSPPVQQKRVVSGRSYSVGSRPTSAKLEPIPGPKTTPIVEHKDMEIEKVVKRQQQEKQQRPAPVDKITLMRTYSAPPSPIKHMEQKKQRSKRCAVSRSAPPQRLKISDFVVTPKAVPLPQYRLQDYPQTFDYDDLTVIREKAANILEKYYKDLKKVSATNSKVIYKQLHVDHMRPTLRGHFKNAYLAYSGEYEPFVVSPWIPFPVPSPWIPYPPLAQSVHAKIAWT